MSDFLLETARDLLEDVLGDDHAVHTVVSKTTGVGTISFVCSCGLKATTQEYKRARSALRNVPEVGK